MQEDWLPSSLDLNFLEYRILRILEAIVNNKKPISLDYLKDSYCMNGTDYMIKGIMSCHKTMFYDNGLIFICSRLCHKTLP